MIDVVISENCKHCNEQLEVMRKSFFDDEYRIVGIASPEFESLDCKDAVVGVPFIIVRGQDGRAKYKEVGLHDGTELRKIERRIPEPFNLSKQKAFTQ
jgi:predicted thioredoxin/glutaredoxin